MPTETKTVHFTLGEDAGILLTTIAQEHLIYNNNPTKALATIQESLVGCPTDIAMKLIRGDLVLMVDAEKQEFLVGKYDESIHKGIFPRLDIQGFVRRNANDVFKNGRGLDTALVSMVNRMRYGSVRIDFSYDDILKFINGDEENVRRIIAEDERVDELSELVRVVKGYIERSMQVMSIVHYMKRNWPEEFDDEINALIKEARHQMQYVTDEMVNMFRTDFGKAMRETLEGTAALDNYVQAAIEIDEIVKKGIEPVDILDNYSAGWLSPDGEYYGLNGEIANMLHNQIASALYDKGGIIPESEENQTNPDGWLMENGWCRIHGNNVLYDGYYGHTYDHLKVIPMTSAQIKAIHRYGQECHKGQLKLGFQNISASMFEMLMESGSPQIWEKYLA